jgi:hypothetical protein
MVGLANVGPGIGGVLVTFPRRIVYSLLELLDLELP